MIAEQKVSIIGVGGAGCRILDRMAGKLSGVSMFAAIDSDSKSLSLSKATTKILVGSEHSRGMGLGGDVRLGRQSAIDEKEMIGELIAGSSLVFVVAGFGGGTGSGAVPVVLESALQAGVMTLCFATLPFKFEGQDRVDQADSAVYSVCKSAGFPMIVIPNERMSEFTGASKLVDAFEKAETVIAEGICLICNMVTRPGYVSVSYADLQNTIRGSGGICTFGSGSGKGDKRAAKAVATLMKSPLMDGGKVVENAKSILVNITAGPDLSLKEISLVMDSISGKIDKNCHIAMGAVVDESIGGRLAVTVIASEKWQQSVEKGTQELPELDLGVARRDSSGQTEQSGRLTQTRLELEAFGKGRFKDVEPTLMNGENLDIPTFIRRGITVGGSR